CSRTVLRPSHPRGWLRTRCPMWRLSLTASPPPVRWSFVQTGSWHGARADPTRPIRSATRSTRSCPGCNQFHLRVASRIGRTARGLCHGLHHPQNTQPRRSVTMRVAFVFSGGANLGASQAGLLQALYEEGIRPDLLVGTSAGAINAAFVASRPQTVETSRDLQRIWRRLKRCQVCPANPLTAGLGVLGLKDHSVSPGPLRRLLSRHLDVDRLQDAPVDLHVLAADLC